MRLERFPIKQIFIVVSEIGESCKLFAIFIFDNIPQLDLIVSSEHCFSFLSGILRVCN